MDDPRFGRLAALIAASPHNLVSRGERGQVAAVHVPEAVALLDHVVVRDDETWLDLGTGGGLPGLALAIARPKVRWILLDATAKKMAAVHAFASALELRNVELVTGRAEDAARDPALRGRMDGVVARAVAPLAVLAELARGFLRPGGQLVAVKGPAWAEEVAAAEAALRELRLDEPEVRHVTSAARPTWVVTMRASGPPPAAYPRRVGVPRQSPIGSPDRG